MAKIRIRETGEVVTETTFRTRNKKARPVLTAGISKERLDQLGADPVLIGAPANPTPPYEYSYESGVTQGDDGVWYTVNSVGPVFTEYTDDDGEVQTVNAQTTAYRARVDADANGGGGGRDPGAWLVRGEHWAGDVAWSLGGRAGGVHRSVLSDVGRRWFRASDQQRRRR